MSSAVITVGVNQEHERNWVFDRPHGAQKWLITCFITPFIVHAAAGREIGQPGDCLVVGPGTPQFHGSVPGATEAFRNDWLYTDCEWLPGKIEALKLPLNRRIATRQRTLLRQFVPAIHRDLADPAPLTESFLRLQIEGILLEIARAHLRNEESDPAGSHRESLLAVRRYVHQRLAHPWTVPEMAEIAGLRRNQFTSLYRQCFGNSPHADLLDARLRDASTRVLSGDARMADIATACGFANVHYFSRAFSRHFGCPPSHFSRRPPE